MLIRKRGAVNYYSSVIIDGKRTELPLGQSLPRALELHAENMRVYRSDVRIKANPPSLSYAKTLFASVIRNAKTRNIYVGITVEDIERMLVNAEFRCEVTGIHFDMIKKPGYRVRPWIPSVDRIDSAKPYTVPNCRVVCAAVNSAMNQYGEEVLLKIAKMMLQKRRLEEKQKNAERADLAPDTNNDKSL